MNLLADHLWQSTLFALAAGMLTLALRKNRARVRHWVWLAASLKFLVPLSLLIGLGSQMEWRRPPVPANVSVAIDVVSEPFTAMPVPIATAPAARNPFPVLLGIWACGFIGLASAWLVRWRRIRAAVLVGRSPWTAADGVRPGRGRPPHKVICSPTLFEPGIFGIFRPVLLLPEGIFNRLTPAQLQAVIEHELCHVRHRDNLVAAIHMFVETVFWFHPLVWWIGKRMVEERERGCDEEVLSRGGEARVYAEAILNVCKLYVESPLECVAGVTGADLKKRIEAIMARRLAVRLSFAKKVALMGVGLGALAIPVFVGLMHAQSVSQTTLKFEVASVKLHLGGIDRNTLVPPTVLPGGKFVSRFPLPFLISYAYKVPFNQSARMTGLPDWAQGAQATYDVEATSAMPPGLSIQARNDRVRAMVQALLADRFKLVIRLESKEMPVYTLLAAKGGPKLQRADIDEKDCPEASLSALGPVSPSTPIPDVCHVFNGGMGRGLHARAANMSDLAAYVENWTDRPLLDNTGIKGLYRFETKGWLPMDPSVGAGSSELADRPTVFEMFGLLGLRMEAQKGIVEVYVIDHIEKPSEN